MSDESESAEEVSQIDEVAALLSEAAEVHSVVFRITDDEDPDWASWYAKWLLELSEFNDLMGEEVILSHLIHELVRLDREYVDVQPDEPWELFYAERLIDEFAAIDLDDDEEGSDEDDEEEDVDYSSEAEFA